MVKKWIRGNAERGAEVIKALKDLGGINKYNLSGTKENHIYFVNTNNEICESSINSTHGTCIMWAGEEIVLPEKKVEHKFKVGDKVRVICDCIIKGNVYKVKQNSEFYILDGVNNSIFREDQLQPANTLKEFDPVMCSNGADWYYRLYDRNNDVKNVIFKSVNGPVRNSQLFKYIVPLSDFNFDDLESNIKNSVV